MLVCAFGTAGAEAAGGRGGAAETHRLQKANVPKLRSMVASNCFARGSRSGTCPTSKFFI